jgi:hypothetical protein
MQFRYLSTLSPISAASTLPHAFVVDAAVSSPAYSCSVGLLLFSLPQPQNVENLWTTGMTS